MLSMAFDEYMKTFKRVSIIIDFKEDLKSIAIRFRKKNESTIFLL
jgi:hypothetical protein